MVVNCEQVWREISNYVDGDVDEALRAAMDEHFRGCKRCTSVLAGTRNVVELYGDERMLEVPAGFSRRLEKKLAQEARGERRWSVWSTWLVPVGALALIIGGLRIANSLSLHAPAKSEHAQLGHDIPPDMVVLVAADTKVFHVAGCTFIHNKDKLRTMTAREALRAGYVPCTRCLRKYLQVARHRVDEDYDADTDADDDVRGAGQ
jgi:hypothetical protein